jgi:HSP20 family protein
MLFFSCVVLLALCMIMMVGTQATFFQVAKRKGHHPRRLWIDELFADISEPFESSLFHGRQWDSMFRSSLSDFTSEMSKSFCTTFNTDVIESENEYKIIADLPGMDPNHLNISIENEERILTIQAERKQEANKQTEQDKVLQSERCFGKVERQFQLPTNADLDKAQSKFVNGVLTISLPKRKDLPSKRRQLKIETSSSSSS